MNNLPIGFDKNTTDTLIKNEVTKLIVCLGMSSINMKKAILAVKHSISIICISEDQLTETKTLMPKYNYPISQVIALTPNDLMDFEIISNPEYKSTPKNYGLRKSKKYRL